MLGVNLHLELKNATTHSQKTRTSQIYDLKSAGDQGRDAQKFFAVALANGDRIHHDGCSG